MAAKTCGCSHNKSWHAGGEVRGRCNHPVCNCMQFDDGDLQTPRLRVPVDKGSVVIKTAPTSTAKEFMAQATDTPAAAEFMLNMAVSALGHHRLNKLSESAALSIARMGANGRPCKCNDLLSVKELAGDMSLVGFRQWGDFNAYYHLTPTHIAEIFNVPQDLLLSYTYDWISSRLEDDAPEEDDELGMVTGWRCYNLLMQGDLLALAPPHHSRTEIVTTRKIQATHSGNREIALAHMAAPADVGQTTVNRTTLEVVKTRQGGCTCGLYCYLDWDEFVKSNYMNTTQVICNVIPFGTVQVGADQMTLRASDLLISRMVVTYQETWLDGFHMREERQPQGWAKFMPVRDVVRESFDNLCQALADQFDVQVDLAHRGGVGIAPEVMQTYLPRAKVELPDWLKVTLEPNAAS